MNENRPLRFLHAALLLTSCLGFPYTTAACEVHGTTREDAVQEDAVQENAGTASVEVDFAAALAGLMLDPSRTDGNGGPGAQPNGLLDAAEMALVAAVLAGEPTPAVDRSAVLAAWTQALESAEKDVEALVTAFPTAPTVVAGYAMVGSKESFAAIAAMTAAFGAPLEGDYGLAAALGEIFGPDGDADGDGFTNHQEYVAAIEGGARAYVTAALDAESKPSPEALSEAALGAPASAKKRVGVVLFPGFEVLDVYGPVEMWAYVPEFELVMIAKAAGPVTSAQGIATVAAHSFASAPPLDVLLVPGGGGTFAAARDPEMLDFLRRRHGEVELTTSVCTGSILLAAAGLLDGRKATSNKLHFHLARETRDAVSWVEKARWVDDGDIVTSSGVSAGMDMALHVVARLYGDAQAEQIASWTEYVWNRDPANDPFVVSAPRRHHAGASAHRAHHAGH